MDWDPFYPYNQIEAQQAPPHCLLRIKRDMMSIHNDPPPGITVVADDADMTLVHALITGTAGTPYEGGFFYFIVRFPSEYPIKAPKVKFMTTGGGKVRFNPNLYKDGKVCLSILGTWAGPGWSPAQSLASVLISIQSLLTEKPYHNEPGYEKERYPGEVESYNDIIRHETLRVAVVGMLDNDYSVAMPETLRLAMEAGFLECYDFYESLARSKNHLTGKPMKDPFGDWRGSFKFQEILTRLRKIRAKLEKKELVGNSLFPLKMINPLGGSSSSLSSECMD